jgi:hypothetical protein
MEAPPNGSQFGVNASFIFRDQDPGMRFWRGL